MRKMNLFYKAFCSWKSFCVQQTIVSNLLLNKICTKECQCSKSFLVAPSVIDVKKLPTILSCKNSKKC